MASEVEELPDVTNKSVKRPMESDVNEKHSSKKAMIQKRMTNKRVKLKNFALLLSYCGKEYYGMQLQRSNELHTIEDLLLGALVDAKFFEPQGKLSPQLYHFQRASRTDKGVSAVKQIVNMNLPANAVDICESLNKILPEDIRVFKAVRVTRCFSAKNKCDSRSYSYLCPTYAFTPVGETEGPDFRLDEKTLKEINETFEMYVGCHNFHNFTSQKSFKDPSSKRYIVSMKAESPFVQDGCEWIRISIHGHSFMLHQIRKMIGLVIAITKGMTTRDTITRSWDEDQVDIPKAPGLGLVLEEPHFTNYNKKFGSDGCHSALKWEDVAQELEDFRKKFIDSTIIKTEIEESSMLSWLATLPLHVYVGRSASSADQSDITSTDCENASTCDSTGD